MPVFIDDPDNKEYVIIDKNVRLKIFSFGDKNFSTGMSNSRRYTNH